MIPYSLNPSKLTFTFQITAMNMENHKWSGKYDSNFLMLHLMRMQEDKEVKKTL